MECVYPYGEGGDEDEWLETEFPPLEVNYDALKHIANCYLPGNHGRCTNITKLDRGSYHEIRVLHFEDGWSCIGRFIRNRKEQLAVTESAHATVRYIRQHTTIPVPETYFVNLNPEHVVGCAFVLMERLPGTDLYAIWMQLTTEHRLAVMEQIAEVLVQLSKLKSDKIGSINIHGELGPLLNQAIPPDEPPRGPFKAAGAHMLSFLQGDGPHAAQTKLFFPGIKKAVHEFLEDQTDDPLYNPPFRLSHGDFDGQNLLFTWTDRNNPPKLSGVIDWDYSFAGPLYYLFDYPCFIQDSDLREEDYAENKILRKNFVRMLAQKFPKGSVDREDVRECFKQKTFLMNGFRKMFMRRPFRDVKEELAFVKTYAENVNGTAKCPLAAYNGRVDYKSDSELGSDDEADETVAGAERE